MKLTKGKLFRESLQPSHVNDISATETVDRPTETFLTLSSDKEVRKMPSPNFDVSYWTVEDIKCQDNSFATPRRHLAEAELPLVDGGLQSYRIKEFSSVYNIKTQDPLAVDKVPPISVLQLPMKALREFINKKRRGQEYVVSFFYSILYLSYFSKGVIETAKLKHV